MLELHGTKTQISPEGIVGFWKTFYAQSIDEVGNIPRFVRSVAGSDKLELTEVSSTQAEEGVQHLVTAKYEGFSKGFARKTYAWQPEEAQSPLETNPNIKRLKEIYKAEWNEDAQEYRWPDKIKVGSKNKEIENPMVGVDSWLDLSGSWTEAAAVEEIPKNLMDGVWSIVDTVPGGFTTPRNRLWLVMPPEVSHHGAAFTIRRRWKMTGVMTPERLEATRMIYTPL